MFDIITDSACDLTLDTAKQLQIEVVPFYVSLDGEHYRKEGKEIAVRDFYQFMVDNPSAYPKTSLASIEDFEQAFRAHAAAGRDVLCLVFTSKMSGCVGSARNARDLVLEDFPDARIEVIDSAAATVTESTMVENAVAMRDAGCTLDETVTWLEAEKATNQIFFTVGNLDYLIKGGRIGKVTGRAANMLGIKPMILFKDGEIFSGGMARGRQKSFEKALEQLMNYLDAHGGTPDDYRITVGYGYDEEEGKRLWMQTRAALRAKYPGAQCEVGLLQIGCTIAVHTGPYALGMGVMRRWKNRAEITLYEFLNSRKSMDFLGFFFRAMLPIQSVFEWNRFLDFYAILLHRISSLLRAKREPEKHPLLSRRGRRRLRLPREAAGCVCFVPCAALASCRPLPQQLLPVSAAGRGRRRCELRAASPLIIPKQMGSIQKIQVAPLEDFLCCTDFESLTRRTVWQGCVFFLAKIMICKLFMNPIDKVGKQEYSFSSRTDRVLKRVKPVRQEVLETVKQLKNSRCFPFGSISAPGF